MRHLQTWITTILLVTSCGSKNPTGGNAVDFSYSIKNVYTNTDSNRFIIGQDSGESTKYSFSISDFDGNTSIDQGTKYPFQSREIELIARNIGIQTFRFNVFQENNTTYIDDVITWEYSDDIPSAPVISFRTSATNSTTTSLILSDSKGPEISEIWIGGDAKPSVAGRTDEEGVWVPLTQNQLSVPVTLSAGDGAKIVKARYKNVFGSISDYAVPATILLKQTKTEGCTAEINTTRTNSTRVQLKTGFLGSYKMYYSITGDVAAPTIMNPLQNDQQIAVFLENSPGEKSFDVAMSDEAGNVCLQDTFTVTIDPEFESEGITFQGHEFWTPDNDNIIDINFNTFENQSIAELKITGDVQGDSTNKWIPYQKNIPITLYTPTSGTKTIYAQFKDQDGAESYLIAKRIYLRPFIYPESAAGFKNIVISKILDAKQITITGCTETYEKVAYLAAYVCHPSASNVSATYFFDKGVPLTISSPI